MYKVLYQSINKMAFSLKYRISKFNLYNYGKLLSESDQQEKW